MEKQELEEDFEAYLDPVKDKQFIEDFALDLDIDPADIPLTDEEE